ncbi:MAG TPA: alanine--tRNA ligase, partial [Caulobacteraceae bacterium]
MPSLNNLRSDFLAYFTDRDHKLIASAPLVPQSDPSLMFVNAGMVPFKNVFTGAERPPAPRATSAQKCVRAGGKHNDLDNVGYTGRHQTFFEMLGNFSFGDYFKEGAIEFAWEFINKNLGLSRDRLIVSIHPRDEDAADLWKKIAGFGDDRIVRLEENLWSMGDTGPIGTNTELFYDHGDTVPGGPPGSAEEDGDRFVEIWNLVFMQWERLADGSQKDLPKPQIDTGMGLERVTTVLQGVTTNYDIDLFKTLIEASVDLTGRKAEGEARFSHCIIADHLRASAFLIADGITPSNEGRGYVLRRIMRRAIRHAQLLGAQDALIWRLTPTLVDQMGAAYPELGRAKATIEETLRQEEERFRRTLGRGLALLDEATAGLRQGDVLSGETAFKLSDTYGFPLDLTEDAIRGRGLSIDHAAYDAAMERQRAMGRENWTGSGQTAQTAEWLALRERLGASVFTGYDHVDDTGQLLALVADGAVIEAAETGQTVQALFDRTPFYAESGGQAGDHGEASWPGGRAVVLDTQKLAGDLHVHTLKLTQGRLAAGERVALSVDPERRLRTRANHSAAHLVHAALGHVLGPHVAQKGQLVDAERMRFDFAHSGPLTDDELDRIEAEVNAVIRQNLPARTEEMAPEAAIAAGAVALFGEKYGDRVRVLELGRTLEPGGEGAYSVELCGGTHVARTGDIALFKIISEGGVAAGIRRIEALTGEPARRWLLDQAAVAKGLADQFKVPVAEVPARVEAVIAERRRFERELAEARQKLAMGGGGAAAASEMVGGVQFDGRVVEGVSARDMRPLVDEARKRLGQNGVVAYAAVNEGKAAITIAITSDLV